MPRDDMINDLSALGGLPFFLVMTGLLTFASPASDRLAVALMMLLGLAACFGVTAAIRWFYFKPRPSIIQHQNWWQRIDASSFPSLHAMRAAFLATVLTILSRYSVAMIIVVTIVTLSVAWARVHKKVHRPIDVIAGIVIGAVLGFLSLVLMAAVPSWL